MNNIKDVAGLAGVSTSTVSRVLSDKGYVSEETRRKVTKAIAQLNYTPNPIATSLKKGRTNMIALLVPSIQNLIFPEIIRGVEDVARQNGISVILCNTDDNTQTERDYIEKLQTRWSDGFIICSMRPDSEHIRVLRDAGIPLVLTTRYYDDTVDAVGVDNRRAAYDAVRYLIKTGHKRIGIALGNCELNIYRDRYEGYRDALAEAGLPIDERLILHEASDEYSFYCLAQNMLVSGAVPDAMFATTDLKAIIMMRVFLDKGLRVPEDISVLGFDNVKISPMLNPPLSTVSQPLYKIGALAMEKLIAQIKAKDEGRAYEPVLNILGTELIVRQSTR